MRKINIFGLVCLLWSAGVLVSRADPAHYVSLAGTNDVGHNYNTWAGAATQIQWAVDVATNTDNTESICVSNGTYNLTNQIVITNAITLYSFKGRDLTIINGNFPAYSNRCLWVSNINALVAGFTITNGYLDSATDGRGGGAFLAGGCISNCIITGNTVTNYTANYSGGGGVYCFCANTTYNPRDSRADSCRIEGNKAGSDSGTANNSGGGGVYLYTGSTLTNCQVVGNLFVSKASGSINGGGGVWNYGEIYNCQIISNEARGVANAEQGGGGVYMNGDVKLFNSVISGNTGTLAVAGNSAGGGGVNMYYGGRLRNCLISRNGVSAGPHSNGNGLYMRAQGTVENCTIMDNNGAGNGGVFYEAYDPRWPGVFINTIVQSNYCFGGLTNWVFANSTNLYITNSCMDLTNFPANVHSSVTCRRLLK